MEIEMIKNETVKEETNEFDIEDINQLQIEDVGGTNTFIRAYFRVDEDNFAIRYDTYNKDRFLCPYCGKFSPLGQECTCDGYDRTVTEDELVDIYEEESSNPKVDIYINDTLVKEAH